MPDKPDGKNYLISHAPFSHSQGFFSSFMHGEYIRATYDQHDLVLDQITREAIDQVQHIANDKKNSLNVTLSRGDLLLTNNHITYYSRNAFADKPNVPSRHLMRIWLSTYNNRPLAQTYSDLYGTKRLTAGAFRGGFEQT